MNTGSWVLDRAWTGPGGGGPYWPGGAMAIGGDGAPPRAVRLLDDVSGARLRAEGERLRVGRRRPGAKQTARHSTPSPASRSSTPSVLTGC